MDRSRDIYVRLRQEIVAMRALPFPAELATLQPYLTTLLNSYYSYFNAAIRFIDTQNPAYIEAVMTYLTLRMNHSEAFFEAALSWLDSAPAATPLPAPTPPPAIAPPSQLAPNISISNQPGLEILEFGYSIVGTTSLFLRYSIFLRNYNDAMARFPSFRITAFAGDGRVLGTTSSVRGDLNPGKTLVWSGQAFRVEERSARIEVEVEPREARNWSANFELREPLIVEGVHENARGNILGQIINPNNQDFRTVWVVAVYRDSNGVLLGGQSTTVRNVPANGTAAFDIRGLADDRAATFEVFTWTE